MVNSILKLTRAQQTRVMIAVLMSKSGLNYFQSVSFAVIEAADLVFYINTTNAWKFFSQWSSADSSWKCSNLIPETINMVYVCLCYIWVDFGTYRTRYLRYFLISILLALAMDSQIANMMKWMEVVTVEITMLGIEWLKMIIVRV